MRFQASNSLVELDTLERASVRVSAISSAVIGRSERKEQAWIWLTDRFTPQCGTKRSTASGRFLSSSEITVITEISVDRNEPSSVSRIHPFTNCNRYLLPAG